MNYISYFNVLLIGAAFANIMMAIVFIREEYENDMRDGDNSPLCLSNFIFWPLATVILMLYITGSKMFDIFCKGLLIVLLIPKVLKHVFEGLLIIKKQAH